jgi:phospholipase/carboxylesterase
MTDLVFQTPDAAPDRLVIVLHGVGSSAADMAPIGRMLAAGLPGARVVVAEGFQPFDGASEGGGAGRQWFSVMGVTPANRSARVDAALPPLLDWIEARRIEAGVPAEAVSLFGFSQGSIMSLAAAARGLVLGSLVAVAGRLVDPVLKAGAGAPRVLVLHGDNDPVIPVAEGLEAAARLAAAGFDVSTRVTPGAHGVSPDQVDAAIAFIGHTKTPAGSSPPAS